MKYLCALAVMLVTTTTNAQAPPARVRGVIQWLEGATRARATMRGIYPTAR